MLFLCMLDISDTYVDLDSAIDKRKVKLMERPPTKAMMFLLNIANNPTKLVGA